MLGITSPLLLIVTLAGFAATVLCLLFLLSIRRREKREITKFCSVADHDDSMFLGELGFTFDSPDASRAVSLRRALAELGRVPPESLRASTRFYPDLALLPFYDSLDTVQMIMAVEEALGIEIPDAEVGHIMAPEILTETTVGNFITAVLAYADKRCVLLQDDD